MDEFCMSRDRFENHHFSGNKAVENRSCRLVSKKFCVFAVDRQRHLVEEHRQLHLISRKKELKMWFEIIPAFSIVTMALAIPGFAIYHIQEAWTGNVSRKLRIVGFCEILKFYKHHNNNEKPAK